MSEPMQVQFQGNSVNFIRTHHSEKQYYLKKYSFLCLVLVSTLLSNCIVQSKCVLNSNMKYELNYTSQLTGYHSLCSEHTKRTCCSGKNFDNLAKKISSKLTGIDGQLSINCRRRLTNIMCSTCDGDIGEGHYEGVCSNLCQKAYQVCKDDYFSIDSLGSISICKQEDLICSKLEHILQQSSDKSLICKLFGYQASKTDCWEGIPSHKKRGPSKKKVSYSGRRKSQNVNNKGIKNWILKWIRKIQPKHLIYATVISILLMTLTYKWASSRYSNYKRQIKNL